MAKDAVNMLMPDDVAEPAMGGHLAVPVQVDAPGRYLRVIEAMLFASAEPLSEQDLRERLPEDTDIAPLLDELRAHYGVRGINLVEVGGKWAFRTSADLNFLLHREAVEQKNLSRAALETLSIIAYHQPATRAEIEEVRGVTTSKGTLDMLMEIGWIKMRGRRRSPGRPITYGTTESFLDHFGLLNLADLPGLAELKGAGLLDANLPPGFNVPEPAAAFSNGDDLLEDEDPLGPELALDDDLDDLVPSNDDPLVERD